MLPLLPPDSMTLGSTENWHKLKGVLDGFILTFGSSQIPWSKCLRAGRALSSYWNAIGYQAQEAIVLDLETNAEVAETARRDWHIAHGGTHWLYRSYTHCLPQTYLLIKTAQANLPPERTWRWPIPREVLDEVLQDLALSLNSRSVYTGKFDKMLHSSDVYTEWDRHSPQCQLSLLEYTHSRNSDVKTWEDTRRPTRNSDWEVHYPLLEVYQKIIDDHRAETMSDGEDEGDEAAFRVLFESVNTHPSDLTVNPVSPGRR